MSIVLNSNSTAATAAFHLNRAHSNMEQALVRLSSGKRITKPSDDAGGLAVSYKIQSVLSRTEATKNNIKNGISFLQVQDGALKVLGDVLDRMAELKSFYNDVSKNSMDRENYNYEFTELQRQLVLIGKEKFNGVSLFSTAPASDANPPFTVITTEDGLTGVVSINRQGMFNSFFSSRYGVDGENSSTQYGGQNDITVTRDMSLGSTTFGNLTETGGTDPDNEVSLVDTAQSLGNFSVADFVDFIQSLANMRAVNGGQMSRLSFSQQMLEENQINLEAANGRIMDADMAQESTRFARYNVLTQAGAAMVSQANSLSQLALALLGN